MKVAEVLDRVRVRANCVYVIPSNRDLSILGGALRLVEPTVPRGLRLPIDRFFLALAEDQGIRSAGVVLSGMGTDGTLGLKAIKAHVAWCWCRSQRAHSSTACRAAQWTLASRTRLLRPQTCRPD